MIHPYTRILANTICHIYGMRFCITFQNEIIVMLTWLLHLPTHQPTTLVAITSKPPLAITSAIYVACRIVVIPCATMAITCAIESYL